MSSCEIVLDVRCSSAEAQKEIVLCVLDRMIELDVRDSLIVITGHDPSGMGYTVDLRKQSRGMFHLTCDERSDGSFTAHFVRI